MSVFRERTEAFSKLLYQKNIEELDIKQLHNAISAAVMESISDDWRCSREKHMRVRRAFYLSAEFLVGRAVYNNLFCTGLYGEAKSLLEEKGFDIGDFEEIEDAALGNGGLGRLAACFLDSAASCDIPLDGYGIRYGFGLFKQRIENGCQTEEIDDWRRFGDPWSVRRADESVIVGFADGEVTAVPYDMPIIGFASGNVATLRLWQAEPVEDFDFDLFNEQKYAAAVRRKNLAENISRVLYPNDSQTAGKLLRLRQQYFFSSASLQDIIRQYRTVHGSGYSDFAKFTAIQLNDTHPVIAVPELIRLMMLEGESFDFALKTAGEVFNYTNHTVMQEALEKWDIGLVRKVSPQIADIINKISHTFDTELREADVPQEDMPQLRIVQDTTVHMAYLACRCSSHINGVAKLHTDILKNDVLKCWYRLFPEKFVNVTNGITQRRWLGVCNKGLSQLVTELLGSDRWLNDLESLRELEKYADDRAVLDRFTEIKEENKRLLAEYIYARDGELFDPQTIADVQIKRLHEYKRQLLNILCILELYFEIKEKTLTDFIPTTFIFGAKAAPGYFRAKAIIKLISETAALIRKDSEVNRFINVIFVSNYNVSYAEKIVAAADVSEQISTAGTEASGTGNMKLMLNGAVTLGTYDGANIEIVGEAGEENNYIFGARVDDILSVRDSYDPKSLYESDGRIKRCLDALVDGTLDDGGTGMFRELYNSLLEGADWHKPDHYFLLLDFDDCLRTKLRVNRDYSDRYAFAKKCWLNMCRAGRFSSDRAVREYAEKIWKL